MKNIIFGIKALTGQIKAWAQQLPILELKEHLFQALSQENLLEHQTSTGYEILGEILIWVLERLYLRHVGTPPKWWPCVKILLKIAFFWLLMGHFPVLTLITALMEIAHLMHKHSKNNSQNKGKFN